MMKVSSVWVRQAEGTHAECAVGGRFFPGFTQANAALMRMARTAPDSGGYHKCDFVVTYEDGEQYEGRFDLKRDNRFGVDIAGQMISFISFYGGFGKPARMTDEQYEVFILNRGDRREECVKFLATYELRSA